MSNKSKPNFKKKEPNARNNNREEFAEDLGSHLTKGKNNGKQSTQQDVK